MIALKRLSHHSSLVGVVLIVAACTGGGGNLGSVPPVPTASASVDPGPDLTPEPSATPSAIADLGHRRPNRRPGRHRHPVRRSRRPRR